MNDLCVFVDESTRLCPGSGSEVTHISVYMNTHKLIPLAVVTLLPRFRGSGSFRFCERKWFTKQDEIMLANSFSPFCPI